METEPVCFAIGRILLIAPKPLSSLSVLILSVSVCVAMATKHNLDSQDPHYKEGRRMAIELKLDRVLAEARRKRARSGGDPPQTSKRDCLGRGKPRGRQGGDAKLQIRTL
ncbi:hypothetical protein QQF64_033853 [Cirrhinus molitorella]|uniref:Uncharacterized protein n=1 Tax=Cirrhinus molitorella TaxID=172907 RepID=A0ABR3MV26_9TELE